MQTHLRGRDMITTQEWTREEIDTNLKRLAYECKLLNRNGVIALVAAVSPYKDQRQRVRQEIGRYIEVYCRCPLEILFKRGQAELFEKAKRGQIAHVAGVNAPYEEPTDPEVLVNTDKESPEQAAARILTKLETLGYIPKASSAEYTAEEEAIIKNRLKDMGYI